VPPKGGLTYLASWMYAVAALLDAPSTRTRRLRGEAALALCARHTLGVCIANDARPLRGEPYCRTVCPGLRASCVSGMIYFSPISVLFSFLINDVAENQGLGALIEHLFVMHRACGPHSQSILLSCFVNHPRPGPGAYDCEGLKTSTFYQRKPSRLRRRRETECVGGE